MAANRHVVMADTDREALETAPRLSPMARQFPEAVEPSQYAIAQSQCAIPRDVRRSRSLRPRHRWRPAKVRDFLARDLAECGVNYLLCRFAFGSLTRAEAERSINLFTSQVMGEFSHSP